MIINKVILGYVLQSFDTDTGKFTGQSFVSGEETWETPQGQPVEEPDTDSALSLEMIQP